MDPDLVQAASTGDVARVAVLLEAGTDVNTRAHENVTALLRAANHEHAAVVALLLRQPSLRPNIPSSTTGMTPLMAAAGMASAEITTMLLGDPRVDRVRPMHGDATYNAALRAVKRVRRARFRGLVRAVVVLRRLRIRAAEEAYAPSGAGCAAAEAHFNALRI